MQELKSHQSAQSEQLMSVDNNISPKNKLMRHKDSESFSVTHHLDYILNLFRCVTISEELVLGIFRDLCTFVEECHGKNRKGHQKLLEAISKLYEIFDLILASESADYVLNDTGREILEFFRSNRGRHILVGTANIVSSSLRFAGNAKDALRPAALEGNKDGRMNTPSEVYSFARKMFCCVCRDKPK